MRRRGPSRAPIRGPIIFVPLIAPFIGEEEIHAVTMVLRSGQLAQGPEVTAFEDEFARAIGRAYAVAMNSGTAAIHAGLAALGIGDGDEVLVTPFTFAATATPILMQRATPRFVDIDPRTYNLEGPAVLAARTAATKAAILVDLFGLPYDATGTDLLHASGVRMFEDACQAVGATRGQSAAGRTGDAAAFSFYATKNMMTGEGGMFVTDDASLVAATRRLRHHGQGERYDYQSLGYNYRMTDLSAAIGRVQLSRLASVTAARQANAAFYDAELSGIPGVQLPSVPPGVTHAYHHYSLTIDGRATANGAGRTAVQATLRESGVASGVYYPVPLHLHPLFAPLGYGPGDFPIAERIAANILALPVHPRLSRAQLEHTVRTFRAAVGASR